MTYAELQADIVSWLGNRSDLSSLAPRFIQYALAALNRELDRAPVPEMESRDTATMTGEYFALPSDFLRMRAVKDADGDEIRYATPQQFATYVSGGVRLEPSIYTLEDLQIRVYPAPTVAEPITLTILYYERVPALANGGDSNWVSEHYPDLLLYGALYHARMWLHDDARIGTVKAMYEDALADLKGRVLTATGIPTAHSTDIPSSGGGFDIVRGY